MTEYEATKKVMSSVLYQSANNMAVTLEKSRSFSATVAMQTAYKLFEQAIHRYMAEDIFEAYQCVEHGYDVIWLAFGYETIELNRPV